MNPRGEAHQRVEEEIRREKAAALGRAGERLDDALRDAMAALERLDRARAPREHDRLIAEYEVARARVLSARMALLIQREAIGLRRHAVVDQLFPEPPRRARGTADGP